MYRSDPEQNGGGYFADGGPHLVSELLWVSGLKARRVTALMDATPSDMRAVLTISNWKTGRWRRYRCARRQQISRQARPQYFRRFQRRQ